MDRLLKAQAHQQLSLEKFQCQQVLNKNQQFNHPDLPQEPLEPLKPPETEQDLHLAQLNPEECDLHKDHFHQLKSYAQEHDKDANVELLQALEPGPRVSPEPPRPPEPRRRGVRSCSSSTSPRLAPARRRAPRRTSPR